MPPDTHPLVALVLLERRFGDDLADARGVAHAGARQINGVAQREVAAAACTEDGVERLEELALVVARDTHAGDAEGVELALGGQHVRRGDGLRRRQGDEALGIVDQFAGEFAIGVAGDGAAVRHRGILEIFQRRNASELRM